MEKVYFIILSIGVAYTVISLVFSGLSDILDVWQIAVGFSTDGISPIQSTTIMAFLTVFGGVGLFGVYSQWNWLFTIIIALILGLMTSILLYKFIFVPLYNSQNSSTVSREEFIGLKAKVTSTILEDGFGTISYVKNGNTYTSPAKEIEGNLVKQGDDVLIVKIDENVFFVMSVHDN